MTKPSLLHRLHRDQAGVSTVLLAGAFTALIGASAFAIDLGSLYLADRKLQGLADSAAMAIGENDFADGSSAVQALLVKNSSTDARVVKLIPGKYTADPAIAPAQRFQPGSAETANAMKVALELDVPLTFGAFMTGNKTAKVHAEAIASRRNLAAYSIGTRLTNVGGNLPNQILSALAGTNLNLSSSDITLLSGTQLDLFGVADAIAADKGLVGQNYNTIFAQKVEPAEFLAAIGKSSGDPTVANLLDGIAPQISGSEFSLAQLANPGELGSSDLRDIKNPLRIDVYTLLRTTLQMSQGATWKISLSLSVPGLAATSLRMAGTNSTQRSPFMTVTAAKNVVLHSSSSRVYLETTVGTGAALLPSLKVPFYLETAPGDARMTAITCASGDADVDGVTLGVKPSIGKAALGTVNVANLDDFSQDLPIAPAELAKALLFKLEGSAVLSLGGNSEQAVFFSKNEIAASTVKSVFTSDAVSSLAGSLAKKVNLTVTLLGLGVTPSLLTTIAGTTLGTIAPTIDSVLFQAMRSTGVGLGVADVSVDRLSCGIPLLVG